MAVLRIFSRGISHKAIIYIIHGGSKTVTRLTAEWRVLVATRARSNDGVGRGCRSSVVVVLCEHRTARQSLDQATDVVDVSVRVDSCDQKCVVIHFDQGKSGDEKQKLERKIEPRYP
jgi:hypothetical protein